MKLENLPLLSKLGKVHALSEPKHKEPASRSFRYMARQLDLEYGRHEEGVCLAYFSPDNDRIAAEGLLMLSYCLQSELNRNVLLIDARVREIETGLTGRLRLTHLPGYAELLRDGCEGNNALIVPTAMPLIDILPAGKIQHDNLFHPERDNLQRLLAEVRHRYHYVLVQVGALVADTRNLQVSAHADSIFLIAQENRTLLKHVDDSQRLLERNGIGRLRMIISVEKQ